jgi:hypothetical protein
MPPRLRTNPPSLPSEGCIPSAATSFSTSTARGDIVDASAWEQAAGQGNPRPHPEWLWPRLDLSAKAAPCDEPWSCVNPRIRERATVAAKLAPRPMHRPQETPHAHFTRGGISLLPQPLKTGHQRVRCLLKAQKRSYQVCTYDHRLHLPSPGPRAYDESVFPRPLPLRGTAYPGRRRFCPQPVSEAGASHPTRRRPTASPGCDRRRAGSLRAPWPPSRSSP